MQSDDVRKKHQDYLFPAIKNYYTESLIASKGNGSRLEDLDGKSYLDFFGGILTVSVGHAHPEVNEAVSKQLHMISHVSTLYPTIPIVELAETLARMAPGDLCKSFFTASGTEADETAIMMAQVFTGNSELIVLRHGYSGRSLLAQSVTGHSSWRAVGTQVAAIKHAPAPYCYRCPLKLKYPDCGLACAEDIEELIQTTTTGQIAGVMVEPILGVGGFITPPPEYFKIVAEIVRRYDGIFISDEVQTGFGRTGKTWGIDQYEVIPDIITMAKGIANGMPLGAVTTNSQIADSLKKNSISTFGGNPVSCAAANATLNIIERDDLTSNAEHLGQILQTGLIQLKDKYSKIIGEVRGMGLMQAIELVVDELVGDRTPNTTAAERLMEETKQRGLLIGRGGLYANTLRIAPALNITRSEIDEALRILDESFGVFAN